VYDGQKKSADFHLARNRIVVELKFVSDANSKAMVIKTLAGLADFYKSNANVRLLLFGVMVTEGIEVDEAKWEQDYSSGHSDVIVRTFVVRVPPKPVSRSQSKKNN
jgi:hypothetical protein